MSGEEVAPVDASGAEQLEQSPIGVEARRFTRALHNGVLATLSRRLEGYPFASVTPFILDHAGCPVILISDIAEHTRNIDADPRVSLIVQPFSDHMQETGRVTLVGQARRLAEKDRLGPRYVRCFPEAESYFAMHDFHFYRIEPLRVRYIGGFGRIHWIEPHSYLTEAGTLAESEDGILAHMNQDHGEALQAYCRHFHGLAPAQVEMIGIDPDGFDVRADGRLLRFTFDDLVTDPGGSREALVAMAKRCRA